MTPTKTYRVSPTFWDDHVGRELANPDLVTKRGKYCVYVRLNAEQYHELLGDAQYYSADGEDWWAEGLEAVRASAKRVLKVLLNEGPPTAGTPEQPADTTETKTVQFGWCNVKLHGECRTAFYSTFDGRMYRCSCECHTAEG
jgi:hypothetical protein